VPVVTSDAGGLTDFVENMVTGVTTFAGDSSSLAWGLLQVLRSPELAAKLRGVALDKVKHIYNWKVIAKRTLEVYDKVLTEAAQIGQSGVSSTPATPANVAAPAVEATGARRKI
jgi:glycosyltransferase involved in cell wall biosynthesis